MTARSRYIPLAMTALLALAACGGGAQPTADTATTAPATAAPATDAPSAPASEPAAEAVSLTLAHSYQDAQPQAACGAKVIADEVAAANTGLTIEIFGQSQLGSDAERITSVVAGDIDMDIQGASALSALYAPMSAVDGAFVFDDSEHMKRFFSSDASKTLTDGFLQETGVRVLGAWNTGARQFTANKAIRTPDDLQGLRMRFPPSPQFLMNAAAMGADPVEVAFEELYLALQQGTADGQENPLTNIAANNLVEVQDVVSLSSHQLSSNLIVINDEKFQSLSADQQAALQAAVTKAMDEEPKCVVTAEQEILDDWRSANAIEIVDDVDREAFRAKAEPYLRANFTPEQVEVLEAIRSTAQ